MQHLTVRPVGHQRIYNKIEYATGLPNDEQLAWRNRVVVVICSKDVASSLAKPNTTNQLSGRPKATGRHYCDYNHILIGNAAVRFV